MASHLKYVKAPTGWSFTDPNPFSDDGAYGDTWSAFSLLDRDDDQLFTGQSGSGPFSARFGRRVPRLESRLADFLRYENRHDRTVILSFPEDINIDTYVTQALACTPEVHIVRPDDTPIIVHSTTKAAWKSIRADGILKAASQLEKQRGVVLDSRPSGQIEEYLSHEPPEYSDHIMFGEVDSYVPEIVVASNQAGQFVMDVNAVYQPGVRLYFDNHRIIQDGLGIRDGLHIIKVYKQLSLQPYLIAAIGIDDIDPDGSVNYWTLKAFVEKTNEFFREVFRKR